MEKIKLTQLPDEIESDLKHVAELATISMHALEAGKTKLVMKNLANIRDIMQGVAAKEKESNP